MRRFRVTLLDPESGAVLELDGSLYQRDVGADVASPSCESEADALTFKDSLVSAFPWAYVAIFDFAVSRERLYRNDVGAARYDEACRALSRWNRLPFFIRWFLRRPPDPRVVAAKAKAIGSA